jgi:hypothetical protein
LRKRGNQGAKIWLGDEGVNTFWRAMVQGSDFELFQESQDSWGPPSECFSFFFFWAGTLEC